MQQAKTWTSRRWREPKCADLEMCSVCERHLTQVWPSYTEPRSFLEKPDPCTCGCHWTVNIQIRERSHSALIKWKNQPACFGSHSTSSMLFFFFFSTKKTETYYFVGQETDYMRVICSVFCSCSQRRASRCLLWVALNACLPFCHRQTSVTCQYAGWWWSVGNI